MPRHKDVFLLWHPRKDWMFAIFGSLDPWMMMGSFEIHGVCSSIFPTELLELVAWLTSRLSSSYRDVCGTHFPGSGSRRERADASPSAGWRGSSTFAPNVGNCYWSSPERWREGVGRIIGTQQRKNNMAYSIANWHQFHLLYSCSTRTPRYRKRFRNWSKSKRMRRKRLGYVSFLLFFLRHPDRCAVFDARNQRNKEINIWRPYM